MKDIKQYFVNGTRIVDERVAADVDKVVEPRKKEKQSLETITGKRERVKIRISRTSSKERTCNIVENKNDLIDKTPSPFNGKVSNDERTVHIETPKSCLTKSKRNLKKVKNLKFNKRATGGFLRHLIELFLFLRILNSSQK